MDKIENLKKALLDIIGYSIFHDMEDFPEIVIKTKHISEFSEALKETYLKFLTPMDQNVEDMNFTTYTAPGIITIKIEKLD